MYTIPIHDPTVIIEKTIPNIHMKEIKEKFIKISLLLMQVTVANNSF